jgi:hypothetical protein
MDNQWSEDLRDAATELDITIEFISTEAKRANRAERAIRTAKNLLSQQACITPCTTLNY